ncbi:hypothetical protein [Streptomyces sp. NPDC050504]|uniref:hypothetical protein n=1 Tax=Streptomyces sp. NPDC050504 TaxID=3365618 RepID=UPI0037A41A8B
MSVLLTGALSETLHGLLAVHTAQERNKEIARSMVRAANDGGTNELTGHWAPGSAPGLRLACESVIADEDRVALRLAAVSGGASWRLLEELRFDAAGRVVEHYGVLAEAEPSVEVRAEAA